MADATCSIGVCKRPLKVVSRGMCSMHHSRFLRTGNAGEETARRTRNSGSKCRTESCMSAASRRGHCRKHYRLLLMAERGECAVDGCLKPWESAGLCGMHNWRASCGDVGEAGYRDQRYGGAPCAIDGCERPAQSRWLCIAHYQYKRVSGREARVFTTCPACGVPVDLRRSDGRLRPNKPLLCMECLSLRPRGRWCMTVYQVARRDGAVCSICDLPVDLALKRPNPLSPSIDHVIPRARGGRDIPDNVALAHLVCNISKGARLPT